MSVQAILDEIDKLDSLEKAQLINNLATAYIPNDNFFLSKDLEQELDKVAENWRKNPQSARPFREVMAKYKER